MGLVASPLGVMTWERGNTRELTCADSSYCASLSARCLAAIVHSILLTILWGSGLLISWMQLRFPHVKAAFRLAVDPGFEPKGI